MQSKAASKHEELSELTKMIWQLLVSQHACASSLSIVPVGPLQTEEPAVKRIPVVL